MDESNRDLNQVMMNVRGASGGIIAASVFSAEITFYALRFLYRLAKKGLVSMKKAEGFKRFTADTQGKYTIYNIPLSAERMQSVMELQNLEKRLGEEKNPIKRRSLEKEIRSIQKEIPETMQMKKLGIHFCVLPKLNGSDQTIQVAVDKENDQLFKNWYLNHLTSGLSGGEKQTEDIKVFTEGNYSIFSVPFEGEELSAACADWKTLGINYSLLPDLHVGDGESQVCVANADREKFTMWFKMWQDKQLREGHEPRKMRSMDENEYANTGKMTEEAYKQAADEIYRKADAEFQKEETPAPWEASLEKTDSKAYEALAQNPEYEKLSINRETLVENMKAGSIASEMQKNGYFISRIPGTFGDEQQILILPNSQVFKTDSDKTFIAFVPKNKGILVASADGSVQEKKYEDICGSYKKVTRNLKKVQDIRTEEVKEKPQQEAGKKAPDAKEPEIKIFKTDTGTETASSSASAGRKTAEAYRERAKRRDSWADYLRAEDVKEPEIKIFKTDTRTETASSRASAGRKTTEAYSERFKTQDSTVDYMQVEDANGKVLKAWTSPKTPYQEVGKKAPDPDGTKAKAPGVKKPDMKAPAPGAPKL